MHFVKTLKNEHNIIVIIKIIIRGSYFLIQLKIMKNFFKTIVAVYICKSKTHINLQI